MHGCWRHAAVLSEPALKVRKGGSHPTGSPGRFRSASRWRGNAARRIICIPAASSRSDVCRDRTVRRGVDYGNRRLRDGRRMSSHAARTKSADLPGWVLPTAGMLSAKGTTAVSRIIQTDSFFLNNSSMTVFLHNTALMPHTVLMPRYSGNRSALAALALQLPGNWRYARTDKGSAYLSSTRKVVRQPVVCVLFAAPCANAGILSKDSARRCHGGASADSPQGPDCKPVVRCAGQGGSLHGFDVPHRTGILLQETNGCQRRAAPTRSV